MVADGPSSDDKYRSVPCGRVWIHGHFVGVVTTSMHRMEIAIPIQHEIPISVLLPVVVAIEKATETEDEGVDGESGSPSPMTRSDASPRTPATPRLSKKLWQDLLKILAVEGGPQDAPEAAVEADAAAADDAAASAAAPSPGTSLPSEAAVLEIDYEAKEALLREVMQQRSELRQKNEELETELQGGALGRLVRRGKSFFGSGSWEANDTDHSGCGSTPVAPARSLRRTASIPAVAFDERGGLRRSRRPRFPSRKSWCSSSPSSATGEVPDEDQAARMEEVRVRVHGHFNGSVHTPKHVLEVNIPIRGHMPGQALLEILRGLAAPLPDMIGSGGPGGSTSLAPHRHSKQNSMPEIYHRLYQLLSAELPKHKAGCWSSSTSPFHVGHGSPAAVEEADATPHHPGCSQTSPTIAPQGKAEMGPGMVLVNMAELEQKLQELERLALQLTAAQPS